MLSNIQKNIIIRAVKIRIGNGEDLDVILSSYPGLTETDKEEITVILKQTRG